MKAKYFFTWVSLSLFTTISLFAIDPVEEKALRIMRSQNVPGMSLVVINNGKSRFYNYGMANPRTHKPVTKETLFSLASITKVFTSTAVAMEILDKKMNLNTPIEAYFPPFKKRGVRDVKKLTLEQLLTHTSSLPRQPPPLRGREVYNEAKVINFLAQWVPSYPIGTQYLYSNLSFGLAGYLLENVEKAPLIEVYRRFILNPLEMNHTVLVVPPYLEKEAAMGTKPDNKLVPLSKPNAWAAGGSLKSTPEDMEKFLAANMGLRGPKKLLEAMKFAQQPRFDVKKNTLKLGLGWQNTEIKGVRRIDKNGGLAGASSYIGFLPDKGVGIVILANRAKIDCTSLGRQILSALLEQNEKSKQ